MIIFAIAISVTLGGITYYLAHRASRCLSYLLPNLPFWGYLAVFSLLSLLLIVGFVRSWLPLSDGFKQGLGAVYSYWMGIFVYLLIFVLLADLVLWIVSLIGWISADRQAFSRFVAGIAVIVLTASVSIYGFCHARRIQTASYEVSLVEGEAHEAMCVVMLSDLHLGAVASEDRLEEIVASVNAQSPDIVCIVGDLFDNDYGAIREPERAIALLRTINAKYGVYASLGNHDSGRTIGSMKEFLNRAGVILLEDSYRVIDEKLVLVGRVDASPIGGNGGVSRADGISTILSGVDPTLAVVIMDHNPAHLEEYGPEADLVLSGHTHKGQVFPGSVITGLMYEVDYGYRPGDASRPHAIVSSGAGTWGPPIRVGSDCEIVRIDLRF